MDEGKNNAQKKKGRTETHPPFLFSYSEASCMLALTQLCEVDPNTLDVCVELD